MELLKLARRVDVFIEIASQLAPKKLREMEYLGGQQQLQSNFLALNFFKLNFFWSSETFLFSTYI